ncbi:MAG: hypothetical protein ABI406_14760 [Ktedonobacteraceae bacterium]
MIQQKQLPRQFAIPDDLSHIHKRPDSLLDMSGLLFKPMLPHTSTVPKAVQDNWRTGIAINVVPPRIPQKLSSTTTQNFKPYLDTPNRGEGFKHLAQSSVVAFAPSNTRQEAKVRDAVIISMDTLPLASLPHLLPASTAHAKRAKTHSLVSSTAGKSKASANSLGKVFCYTLAAGVIIVIYMIIPLMTTLIPLLTGAGNRLLISLEILAVIEFIVCRILTRTIRR